LPKASASRMAIRSGSLRLFRRAGPAGAVAGHHICLSRFPWPRWSATGEPTASADVDAELLSPAGVPSHCVLVSVSLHASQALLQAVSGHISAHGGLVAIAAALSTACATIAIRHLGATEAVATTVFWFGATSLIPLGLAMPFVAHAHDAATFAVIAGLSIAGGIAQLALTGALRLAPVALVMPMDYSGLLWATMLGLLVFNQRPSHWTWLGAPIVIGAGLVILWREHRLRIAGSAVAAVPEVNE